MYDDIAFNEENPRPGIIINSPHGDDVYKGVPKVCYLSCQYPLPILYNKLYDLEIWYWSLLLQDYTGEDVTVNNLFAVILGNKTALTGGSGKVVDSGPNDHIFIYYTDHGGPGVLG